MESILKALEEEKAQCDFGNEVHIATLGESNRQLWQESCKWKKERDALDEELQMAKDENTRLIKYNNKMIRSRDELAKEIEDFQYKRQKMGDTRAYSDLLTGNAEYRELWEDVKVKTLEVTQDVEKVHDVIEDIIVKLNQDKSCVDWAIDQLTQANTLYKPYVEFLTKFSKQDVTRR